MEILGDSVAIPHSSNSQSIRGGWFIISFIYVAVTIAKSNPYLGGGGGGGHG